MGNEDEEHNAGATTAPDAARENEVFDEIRK